MKALIFAVFGHMRPAAEIDEVRPQRVLGENLAGTLVDQLAFHPGIGVLAQPLVLVRIDALVRQVPPLDFPHLLLDLFQIFRRERRGAVEIVIKAVLDGRPDAELRLGKQFEHGRSQQVRGRMAVHLQRFRVLGGQDLQRRVLLHGAR